MEDTGDTVRVMDQEDRVIVQNMEDMVDLDQLDMGDMERGHTAVRDMDLEAMAVRVMVQEHQAIVRQR